MSRPKHVFIVGWYGTETVGDKAILGGILECYRRQTSAVRFSISSLYPFVTRQTLKELGEDADIVRVHGPRFLLSSALSDEVVMGGGPLMDMDALSIPLWAFAIARLFGRRRVVWGCGLGPLTQPRYVEATRRILLLASNVKLRDSHSVAWAAQLTGRIDIEQIADPAKDFVLSRRSAIVAPDAAPSNILACFLRDWPLAFGSDSEYAQIKTQFETHLAACILDVCQRYRLKPIFYAMHTLTVGGDDREFNRRFASTYLPNSQTKQELKPASVDSIAKAMLGARLCVCMRFHSVLFAHTLRRPYVAIDYTLGGKVRNFLQDERQLQKCVSLLDLAHGSRDGWDSAVASALQDEI